MKEIHLHNPTYLELDDAYRSITQPGYVVVKSADAGRVIQDMEKIGFVAIEYASFIPDNTGHTIRASKGKHGPCHFTGKTARYTGVALAALDDDNHLLFKDRPLAVCDKTDRIFGLPAYKGLIERKGSVEKTGILHPDSGRLYADDFESGQAFLYDLLKSTKELPGQRKAVFYPGPFRMLILTDGVMVRRGQWCSIAQNMSRELIRKEGCIGADDDRSGQLILFQEEYKKSGAVCLMQAFRPEALEIEDVKPDFLKLGEINKELKARLSHIIDHQKKYFILIGHEVDDHLGCCPSQEVTDANLLVKYGILSSLAEPLPGDACPVTVYAFKDELTVSPDGFTGQINEAFRSRVRKALSRSPHSVLKKMLKGVLLVFVIISLGLAVRKCQSMEHGGQGKAAYEQLLLTPEDRYVVVLFHNQKRCYQCLQMEKLTQDLLTGASWNELGDHKPAFKTIVIDNPENEVLISRFGIFAPTLVLMEFNQGELVNSKKILNVTGLYRDEELFKEGMEKEVRRFVGE